VGYEKIIHGHYEEINSLSMLLRNYIEMYRLLVSSASELNTVATAKKSDVKHSLERIDELGDVIDDLLKAIKRCEPAYIRYLNIKNEVINESMDKSILKSQLISELEFYNQDKQDE